MKISIGLLILSAPFTNSVCATPAFLNVSAILSLLIFWTLIINDLSELPTSLPPDFVLASIVPIIAESSFSLTPSSAAIEAATVVASDMSFIETLFLLVCAMTIPFGTIKVLDFIAIRQ